jgi:hypothetical protein
LSIPIGVGEGMPEIECLSTLVEADDFPLPEILLAD